jgi:peptide-methionine (S)-S-oxide reductase
VRTRVGYAGGTTSDPTYSSLGDYSESIQIEYDPLKITYKDLLNIFWNSHDATQKPWSTQYKSIIFYHTEEQRKLAEQSKNEIEAKINKKVYTEIRPADKFYQAETYHQKYILQGYYELIKEFREIYPVDADFIGSTAAARVNGYLSGYGNLETLQKEINMFGLSEEGQKTLLDIVRSTKR